jgi:hypothetical protein
MLSEKGELKIIKVTIKPVAKANSLLIEPIKDADDLVSIKAILILSHNLRLASVKLGKGLSFKIDIQSIRQIILAYRNNNND